MRTRTNKIEVNYNGEYFWIDKNGTSLARYLSLDEFNDLFDAMVRMNKKLTTPRGE